MDWKRTAASVVTAAIFGAAVVYTEAAARPPERKDRVVVTYWEKWTGFEADAMRDVVDKFNRSQDRIFVDFLTVSGIQNKTLLATAGGIPPDVAGLFGANLAQYASSGSAIPLDSFVQSSDIRKEDYIPGYWEMCQFDGQTFAMPSTPASYALHVNRGAWKEAGLDPSRPPQTLEEFEAMNDRLTIRKPDGGLKQAGFLPSYNNKDVWGFMFGSRFWDPETGQATANGPENVRAFEWGRRYAEKYGKTYMADFQQGFGSFSSPENPFFDGKLASVMQGVWMANFIGRFRPDMDWDAFPFPHPADRPDLKNTTFLDLDILVIPRGAKHPKEAWEFVKFVQQQENMELLCFGQQKHTPLVKVSSEFWAKHPNKKIRLFYDLAQSPNALPPPKLATWSVYSRELANAFDAISDEPTKPGIVKEQLDYVQRRVQPHLDREMKVRRARKAAR